MTFNIQDHLELDAKGRAVCPSCVAAKGEDHRKRNLSVDLSSGAYHCFAGCTSEDIRAAVGQPKDAQVPQALAPTPPAKPVSLSAAEVAQQHDRLMTEGKLAKEWLIQRGFTEALMQHYQLGIVRKYLNKAYFWGISIPIRQSDDTFYQKLRIGPWRPADEIPMPWHQKGIPAQVWLTHNPQYATSTWLCEGEWDAMRLGYEVAKLQLPVAVACFTCGCDTVPPTAQLDLLPGKTVAIWYDRNDKPTRSGRIPGDEGAKKVAIALGDRGLIGQVPMPEDCDVNGWDVSDALAAGYKVEDFIRAEFEAIAPKTSKPKAQKILRGHMATTAELIARAPDYVEWLVNDILTSNELFLLAAPPRGGKSLFAMGLSKAVATGSNFLDRPTMQGPVIYVNLEDADAKIRERVEAQQWPSDIDVYWLDAFKLSQLDELIEIIEEIGPRLVVLDTLTRIRSEGVSESSAEIGLVLEPLQECAKRNNTCILLIHHTKKINVEDGDMLEAADSIRGSSAIRATCRGTLVIAPGQDSYRLVAENGHGKHDLKVRLNANTLEWNLLGKWTPAVNLDMKTSALDYLDKVGEATCEEISMETGWKPKSMHIALSRLVADGIISKKGNQRSATYIRAVQQVQQLNSLLNSPNAKPVSSRGVCSTKNIFFSIEDPDSQQGELIDTSESGKNFFVEHGGKTTSSPYVESENAVQQQFNSSSTVEPVELNPASASRRRCVSAEAEAEKNSASRASTQPQPQDELKLEENYSPTLPNGKKTDCRIRLGNNWIWAKYYKERPKMRLSSINKTLEPAHAVDIVNGPTSVKRIEVAESEIQWLEGEDNADG
jgi:AAA domain